MSWTWRSLHGSVRKSTAPWRNSGHPSLVVDLTEVPFCDSVGLGILVGTLTRIRESGGRLILVVSPGMITHLLTITNLDRHFETCGSLSEALDAAA